MFAPDAEPTPRLARFALWTLIANVLVVLWGAVVRATGAGAGCGSHWPLCNGQVVPRSPTIATLVELTHRVTSGVALLLVMILAVWCFRALPRRHPGRRAAATAAVLMVVEAGIGAGLVLFSLVGRDASVGRAAYMGLHLAVTFLLLAALALTAWWATGAPPVRLAGRATVFLAVGAAGLLLVGASGAVAALGDTLFPAGSLAAGMRQDVTPGAHFLLRLRVVHPLLATTVGAYLLLLPQLVGAARRSRIARRLGSAMSLLALAQVALGAVNLGLLAPVGLQLLHLLLADAVWVALVLFAAAVLADARPVTVAAAVRTEMAERAAALPRR
ncbi:MAG TPA: COX15/CtaA family protein [Thermoanaerobaculia bacterium]|nr:COX15/CtaA family protein [Thermoanaerobaculia bacterium]